MTLLNKAKAMGVEVRTSTKVVELIADPKTGGVAGAKVKTKGVVSEVYAKYGVVLATGGFSANQALVTQYIGSAGAKMPIRGSRIVAGENIVLGTLPAQSCQRRPVPLRSDLRPDRRQPAQHCQQRRLRQSSRRSLYR